MHVSQRYKSLVLWLFAATIAIAVLGKALHTHSDEYWQSLTQTEGSAEGGMSDICPICHFQLFLFFSQSDAAVVFLAIVLLFIVCPPTLPVQRSEERIIGLRAPPVM